MKGVGGLRVGGGEAAARGLCMMNWIENLSSEEKQHIT